MKHTFQPRALAAFAVSFITFLLSSLLLTLACILTDRPLFYLGGGAWIAFCILLALNAACQIPLTLISRDLAARRPTPGRAAFAGILAALASLAFSIGSVYRAFTASGVVRIPLLVTALFALIGAVGLALHAVYPGAYPTVEVLTLSPLPLSCVSYVLSLYFETSVPKNGSLKLLLSLCFILLAVYLVTGIRRTIGEPRPRLSLFLARTAAPLLASVAFAALFLKIFRGLSLFGATAYVFLAVFSFYMFIVSCVPALGDLSVSRDGSPAATEDEEDLPAAQDSSLPLDPPRVTGPTTPPTENRHESE